MTDAGVTWPSDASAGRKISWNTSAPIMWQMSTGSNCVCQHIFTQQWISAWVWQKEESIVFTVSVSVHQARPQQSCDSPEGTEVETFRNQEKFLISFSAAPTVFSCEDGGSTKVTVVVDNPLCADGHAGGCRRVGVHQPLACPHVTTRHPLVNMTVSADMGRTAGFPGSSPRATRRWRL